MGDRRVRAASRWIKAGRLRPRESNRFTALDRSRAAVERFGQLKEPEGLSPLRVWSLDRVRLHADLTIVAKTARTLARARALPLAA